MSKVFLIDNNESYDYSSLVDSVNKCTVFYPFFRTTNLKDFFLNLIIGLIYGYPITLVDSDINIEESIKLGVREFNVPVTINQSKSKNTLDDILVAVTNSESEISIFTSGTTGQPKCVIHKISNIIRFIKRKDNYKNNIWGFAYNSTHIAGLQVFFQAFLNTNTIVNLFIGNRKEILDLIEKYNVTHISATPTFYRLLLPSVKTYTSVERATLGGEKSDETLYNRIKETFPGAKINNIYASTEAGSLLYSNNEYFQIPPDYNQLIKVSVENELLVHNSLLGKSGSLSLEDGFYNTGDLIIWHDEGKGIFKFLQRKNELINSGGYKINPSEIEDVLRSIGGIEDAVVYGKPNSVLGNILCADVKKENHSEIQEYTIREHLARRLQSFKIPRKIYFVEEISMTRTGKIKRK